MFSYPRLAMYVVQLGSCIFAVQLFPKYNNIANAM